MDWICTLLHNIFVLNLPKIRISNKNSKRIVLKITQLIESKQKYKHERGQSVI